MRENKKPPTPPTSQNQAGAQPSCPGGLALAACLLGAAIFALDILLPLGAVSGMPYAILMMLGWFAECCSFTLATAAATSLLTIAGHPLSFQTGDPAIDLANRAIALAVIWSMATLLFHGKRRERSDRHSDSDLRTRLCKIQEELESMRTVQRRLEGLATMGQKAGTTAHELRNPLGAIATSMSVIGYKAQQSGLDLGRPLERANRAIRRCEHIIDEHLDAARARGHRPESLVLDGWLTGLLAELDVSTDISLSIDLQAQDVIVDIDPDSFRRVLINLVDNAIQALSERSKDRSVTVGSRAHDDGVDIFVADNGPGIAPHLLGHVTEALFSTKPYGTGLGLPTVQRIVNEHDGAMTIESEPQRGTRMTLRLPISARA